MIPHCAKHNSTRYAGFVCWQASLGLRIKRSSPHTVKTYCYWIRYFIRFNGLRYPASMGGSEVKAFLEHLAVQRHVAAATQN
ncbi:hypothetical protein HLV40_09960 [Chromohalobacter salexigens]|nr:hypothetical protein [Chromohalobacter salexigens]